LLITFSSVSAFPVCAQKRKGPKFVLKEKEFDFGEVKEGAILKHSFSVRNKGNEPLRIIRVKPG
jgi:hypothetical protein